MVPVTVDSAAAAIELLDRRNLFGVVIANAGKTEIDGLTLTDKIRAKYAATDLPIILLTTLENFANTEYHDRGVNSVVTKPIKTHALFDELVSVMESTTKPASASSQDGYAVLESFHRMYGRQKALAQMSSLAKQLPLRILLAEDNLVNQRVALKMLERSGYRADVAADGQEAIDALRRQPYDLVLMDIRMPNVDGIQATQYIRQHIAQDRQPTIVAMTAEALEGDKTRLLDAGMDQYIAKPVKYVELAKLLETIAREINNSPSSQVADLYLTTEP